MQRQYSYYIIVITDVSRVYRILRILQKNEVKIHAVAISVSIMNNSKSTGVLGAIRKLGGTSLLRGYLPLPE